MSFARSLRYPIGGFQTPEKSGLPSGKRGAGAARLTLPSGVRGRLAAGTFDHHGCANNGVVTDKKTRLAPAVIRLFLTINLVCMAASRVWGDYTWCVRSDAHNPAGCSLPLWAVFPSLQRPCKGGVAARSRKMTRSFVCPRRRGGQTPFRM